MIEAIPNDQIGDCENPPIFPSEENWLGFRRRLSFPSSQGTMPASGLQTVFSITQSDHSKMHSDYYCHSFGNGYFSFLSIDNSIKKRIVIPNLRVSDNEH